MYGWLSGCNRRLHVRLRAAIGVLLLIVGLGVWTAPAVASGGSGEGPDTVSAFLVDYTAAKKSKDVQELVRLCARASKLYDDVTTEKLRKQLIDAVGKAPSIKRSDEVLAAVLDALGEMADPKGAKYIKKYLRMRNKEHASDTLQLAIKTAGLVPDKSLVGPLLTLYDKSKVIRVKQLAATALSNFGSVKRHRCKILETLIGSLKSVKPGGHGRMSGSGANPDVPSGYGHYGGPAQIWSALSPIMPRILNKLTGQDVATLDTWFGIYNANKRNPKSLFVHDED